VLRSSVNVFARCCARFQIEGCASRRFEAIHPRIAGHLLQRRNQSYSTIVHHCVSFVYPYRYIFSLALPEVSSAWRFCVQLSGCLRWQWVNLRCAEAVSWVHQFWRVATCRKLERIFLMSSCPCAVHFVVCCEHVSAVRIKNSSAVDILVLEQSAKIGYTLTALFRAFTARFSVC